MTKLSGFYAGIGSRETPFIVCQQMTETARWLYDLGFFLRSGGAVGADTAFERGAGEGKEIYRAEDANTAALALAAAFHPNWSRCSPHAKKLLARNGFQILGPNLKSPSDFVVCWTADGRASGGTGQALRIAADKGIPIFNLHDQSARDRLKEFVLAALETNVFNVPAVH